MRPNSSPGIERYFGAQRRDVLGLVPAGTVRVLDVGCGTGANIEVLREDGRCTTALGIEANVEAAAVARQRLDQLFEGDVERISLPIAPASLDAILCLDVLEHLVDPWAVVRRLTPLLAPRGVLVVSVPNIRNYKVTLPLILRGRFEYDEAGILDRTHLRFFTRASARELARCSGLVIDAEAHSGIGPGGKREFVNRITRGLFADLMITQFYLRARRPGTPCP